MGHRGISLAVGAALLLTAGCGGGGGPRRSEYVAHADRLCRLARAETAPLVDQIAAAVPSLTPASARRLAPAVQRLHAAEARWLGRLDALEQPSADHAAIMRFLQPAGRLVDALGEAGRALDRGESVTALLILQRSQTVSQEADAAARDYGLASCGSLVSTGG